MRGIVPGSPGSDPGPGQGWEGTRGRVAMVVRNPVSGDSRVRKSASALASAGWDVTVLGTSPDDVEHRLELDGVPVVLVPVPPVLTGYDRARVRGGWPEQEFARWWAARRELARRDAALRGRGREVRWVHDAHELSAATADRGVGGLRGLLRRRMIGGMLAELVPTADAVVTVSDDLAERLRADLRLPDRPVVVLNAPPVASARPAPSLRKRAGVRPEERLLVYAGGLTPARGVDLAVRALPELDGVHLALVAPDADPHVAGLCALADGLGVGERLHVVPYVAPDQVVDYLAGADAGLVPLLHRPNHEISLVTKYIEYAQAKLPLVVSDVRVMAAFTREHGLGEVFRVQDGARGLADAARAVLSDRLRYRAAYDAAAGVLARLTWEEQSTVLTGLYEHIAHAAGSRTPAM